MGDFIFKILSAVDPRKAWNWFFDWTWSDLLRVWKPITLIVALAMLLAFYGAARTHADGNPYWRLSNDALKHSVLAETSIMLSRSRAQRDPYNNSMLIYDEESRTVAVQFNEVLADRLGSAQIQSCAPAPSKKLPDFAKEPSTQDELKAYADCLWCMARKLPPHRDLWSWLVSVVAP